MLTRGGMPAAREVRHGTSAAMHEMTRLDNPTAAGMPSVCEAHRARRGLMTSGTLFPAWLKEVNNRWGASRL